VSAGPGFLRALGLVLRKDLRVEARSRGAATTMLVFALLVLFTFALAMPKGATATADRPPGAMPPHAAGVLWVAILFAAVIGASRAYAVETAGGGLDGLALSPADPAAVYLGKLLALGFELVLLALVVVPAAFVLFGHAPGSELAPFALFAGLGIVGIAAVACLLGALTAGLAGRDFVLPLLLLPIALPQLVALVRGTDMLLAGLSLADLGDTLVVVAAFDLAHLAASAVLFEFVVGGD